MSATPQTQHSIHSAHKETRNIALEPRSWQRQAVVLFGITALYFLAAKFGFTFAYLHTHVSPIWPPTGIAIAAVLLFGYRVAPAILIGAFLSNANAAVTVSAAIGIAIGNTLEAIAAGWLLKTLKFDLSFGRARDVSKFVIAALVCSAYRTFVEHFQSCFISGMVRVGNDDDKLKRIGHSLTAFNVDRFQFC